MGFPYGVELGDVGGKPHSNNRRVCCSMEKVVKETGGREVHVTMRSHNMQLVFIPSMAGRGLRTLAEGRLS